MVQSTQEYTIEEVAQHNSNESTWIILNNKVYDVTKFLLEHPGGEEVILEHAGKDATVGFDDVNHSSDAKQMAEDYLIGHVAQTTQKETKSDTTAATPKAGCCTWTDIIYSPTWSNFLIPAAISIGVLVAYKVAQKFASNL